MIDNVRTIGATFSSVTLTWDKLDCVDRNGELTTYRIEYDTTTSNITGNDTNTTTTTFTVTGLNPNTTYMFRVAGVNSNGTGIQSTTVYESTLPSGKLNQL